MSHTKNAASRAAVRTTITIAPFRGLFAQRQDPKPRLSVLRWGGLTHISQDLMGNGAQVRAFANDTLPGDPRSSPPVHHTRAWARSSRADTRAMPWPLQGTRVAVHATAHDRNAWWFRKRTIACSRRTIPRLIEIP